MSKRRGKIIVVESDEKIDSYPHLLIETLTGPQISPDNVGPTSNMDILEYPRPGATPSPSSHEPSGDRGGQPLGSRRITALMGPRSLKKKVIMRRVAPNRAD